MIYSSISVLYTHSTLKADCRMIVQNVRTIKIKESLQLSENFCDDDTSQNYKIL